MIKPRLNKYEMLKILAKNIEEVRTNKKVSIKELSKKSKIREQYLKRIENGLATGISIKHIFKIAFALKVNPSELVKGL